MTPDLSSGPTSGNDPLERMGEILKDEKLSDEQKKYLLQFSATRFKHRRRMAYIALWTVISSLALLLLMAAIDCKQGTTMLAMLKEVQSLLIVIEVFLTGIVGAYYGTSTARPSS